MRWSLRSIALAQALLVLAACSAGPGTSSAPLSSVSSPTASPSTAATDESAPSTSAPRMPSAEPSVSAPGDSVPIPADTYARVVTDDLRVRSKPGVSDDSKKLEPLLQDGELIVIVDGPVQASGYDWYQVQPVIRIDDATPAPPFGWVAAAGKDGEPWIESATVDCPAAPADAYGLTNLGADRQMFYGITCFSGQDLTIEARLVAPEIGCEADPPWTVEPLWLDSCGGPDYALVPLDVAEAYYHPFFEPDVDLSIAAHPDDDFEDWPFVEARGMFDHPAAMTCRNVAGQETGGLPEPDPASTILGCRAQFVVTSIRRAAP
jgi:hypothetical protein